MPSECKILFFALTDGLAFCGEKVIKSVNPQGFSRK